MQLDDAKIKDILLSQDYISEEDAVSAEEFVKKNHVPLVEHLLTEGTLTKDLLGQAIAEFFKISYANLVAHPVMEEAVQKIPEDIAKEHRVVLFKEASKQVIIATDDPEKKELTTVLKPLFAGKTIKLAFTFPEFLNAAFSHYKKTLSTRFEQIIKEKTQVASDIIDAIFEDALMHQSSDIHFEPQENETVIRFRVDGVLYEAGRIEKLHYENILNRIKVQAHLRIDEHFAPQDGAIRHKKGDVSLDMRVAIVPTLEGEKITIRLLSQYIQSFSLAHLGLSEKHQEMLEQAAHKPFGMILVTGPTGAGKTTTLYAVLKILNRPEVNITTIEDPVEYRVLGANQIQVNTQTDLTFAKGLRSIVRQDPDVILVGEIRDLETAEIGVNAALTGHLLLSTFHANDAATALPRLLDMGVEPFLLASTLEVIIAQRLVREICSHCRHSHKVKQEEIAKKFPNAKDYFSEKEVTLYKGKGCETCSHSGYKGRKAIFEFIEITSEMEELILTNPSTQQIWNLARKQGSQTLFEDGIEKVKNGVTTLEEVLRITSPPDK
jgi:type IV pilus assembly protein PilB